MLTTWAIYIGSIFMFFWSAQHSLRWGPWHWYASLASSRTPWEEIAWTLPLLTRILSLGGALYLFYCLITMQVAESSVIYPTISGVLGTLVYLQYQIGVAKKDPPPHG